MQQQNPAMQNQIPLVFARQVLEAAHVSKASIATAESCTGGYVAALRAGVERQGAVSRVIALQMARAVLYAAGEDLAVAVSGYTGAAGVHENGLVHIAVADRRGGAVHS